MSKGIYERHNKGIKSGFIVKCKVCNKDKYVTPSDYKSNISNLFFCSSSCSSKYYMKGNHNMFGKKHNKETLKLIGEKSRQMWKQDGFVKNRFENTHKGIKEEDITNMFKNKMTLKDITKRTGVNRKTIKRILLSNEFEKEDIKDNMRLVNSERRKADWKNEKYRKKKSEQLKEMFKRWKNNPEEHPSWKGGISKEPYDFGFNNQFKNSIRKRDNQVCMNCGIHREKLKIALSIHHINYDKKLSIPENCLSLCNSCHTITNSNREHWIKFFQSLLSEKYKYVYENNLPIINIEVKNKNGYE